MTTHLTDHYHGLKYDDDGWPLFAAAVYYYLGALADGTTKTIQALFRHNNVCRHHGGGIVVSIHCRVEFLVSYNRLVATGY